MAEAPWQRALRLRSEGMNKRYGITTAPKPAATSTYKPTNPGWGAAANVAPNNAPPGTVTDAPIPGVSAYGAVMARAQDAYNQAVIASRSNKTRNLASLGFDENGAVQGENLYGAYQQNRRSGALNAEASQANAVNRGLGTFGGLADQGRNDANFEAGVGMTGILGQAQSANAQAAADVQSADWTLQDRLAQAQLDAAQTNIESRNFTTAAEPAAAKTTAGGIQWAGQTVTTKAQLAAILAKSGVKYATWAKNHAAAAAKLK